jgi:hypothetical protein
MIMLYTHRATARSTFVPNAPQLVIGQFKACLPFSNVKSGHAHAPSPAAGSACMTLTNRQPVPGRGIKCNLAELVHGFLFAHVLLVVFSLKAMAAQRTARCLALLLRQSTCFASQHSAPASSAFLQSAAFDGPFSWHRRWLTGSSTVLDSDKKEKDISKGKDGVVGTISEREAASQLLEVGTNKAPPCSLPCS